jgi:hypothetical protein
MQAQSLSNLQLELVNLFRYQVDDSQLIEIKDILSQYFANKASDEMDKLWEERGWSNETMEKWVSENLRIQKPSE